MRYPLPLVSALVVVTLAGGPRLAGAKGVPEFGCAEVSTLSHFGLAQEEDCPPGDQAICDAEPLPQPVAVDTHNYPSDCRWVTAQSSNAVTMATCPAGTHVLAGGCSAPGPLGTSSPWEDDATNVPDKNESFLAVDDPNGWLCVPTANPFTVTMTTATALCCGTTPDIAIVRETLQDCGWVRVTDNGNGGVFAGCPAWTVPVASGLYAANVQTDAQYSFLNLAPAGWNPGPIGFIDGFVDGEPLASDHPYVHGEPPDDGTLLSVYVGDLASVKGTGKHMEAGSAGKPQFVLSLCCGVPIAPKKTVKQRFPHGGGTGLSNAPIVNGGAPRRLTNCDYERVLSSPMADAFNSPQYVAKLACRAGKHVVSGGCYAQFLHAHTNAVLAGSHPYKSGDYHVFPASGDAQATLDGENGWVCRLDGPPQPFISGPAKVLVEAICCD